MSEESESKKLELVEELQDKATRDAFVSSQMSIPLAFQIQALREQQGLTQKQLAEKAGMLQPRIAAMERPSGSEPNLRTLKRLASAFDVALIVRFAPFSELVKWAENFSPDTFIVPSFENDPGFHPREPASAKLRRTTVVEHEPVFTDSLQQSQNTVGEGNTPLPEGRPASMPTLHAHESTSLPEQSSRPLRRRSTPLDLPRAS